MKKLFTFLILIFTFQISWTQNNLTGRITDGKTGGAVAGATVYLPDLKTGDIADQNGVYKLEKLPSAKVTIQVSFIGYKSIIRQVDLSETATQDFVLEQAITEMNEVVVTGESHATEIVRNPIPMITVDLKELHQSLNTNIIDAISKLPGVNAVSTGPNISKPFIHGLGFNRVLTLFDGVRQEGQQWGDEHGVEIDENTVDRIEIVKGPSSLTYGPDALAGVINMLPFSAFHMDTIQGQIETNYQTNNRLINTSVVLNGNRKGIVWGGVITRKQAVNYQNKYDGRVYGTAFNESDLRVFAGLNKKWGYSHLSFSMFNDLQEIPDGSRDSVTRAFTKQITEADTIRQIVPESELNTYKISVLHQHVIHSQLYSSSNFILGKSKLSVTTGYQQSIRQEFSHPQNPNIPGLDLDLKTFTYDLKYMLPEENGWEGTFGLNGMYQKSFNKGTEFLIPDYSQFDIGPFILYTKTAGKLDLSAGLRYDTRVFRNEWMYVGTDPVTGFNMKLNSPGLSPDDVRFSGYNHVFSGMSGSFGATYNITEKLLIKSNVARGFRAPNILEISSNGVHSGTLIYQIGNKSFRPEFSLQEDLGISYRSDHISGDIDFFNNDISNYIFNQKLLNGQGQDSVIIKGNQTFKFQQARARLYGGEASIDVHPFDWLHFENSISVIYAINRGGNGIIVTSDSKYLPFIPPLHTITDLRATIGRKLKHLNSFYLKLGIEYYSRQNRVYSVDNTETTTPGYILFNAGIGAEIKNTRGKVLAEINLLGNNLTNTAYQSHLSRLKYFEQYPGNLSGKSGIYEMGRNISLKVIFPLNI